MVSPQIIPHEYESPKRKAPDGGWGWVVVFASFMISLTADGFAYTSGIFYEKFLDVYKESEAVTSIFDSVMTGMIFLTGPFASGLSIAFGCRTVAILGSVITVFGLLLSVILDSILGHILALGAITGSGLGLQFLPQIIIVTYWFDKRLSFATGIAVCGSGIGIAVFAVLTEYLFNWFGWKGAMITLAGILFTNVFFSSLFRKVDGFMEEKPSLKSAFDETFNFRILTDVVFIYFSAINFLIGTVYYVPVIFLKDHVMKTGIGDYKDAMIIMASFGLSNAFGRAVFGYFADNESLNRLTLFGISVISYGTAIGAIAAFGHTFTRILIGYIVFGAAEGAFVCLSSVVMVDLFGVSKVSNAFGIANLIIGGASLIGPPLIGRTVDHKNGYTTGLWISSGITVFSGVLLLFLPLVHKKFKPKE